MFKQLVLIFVIVFSGQSVGSESLEIVMKEMALSYKNARQATTKQALLQHVNELESAITRSKAIGFKQKPEQSIAGLVKVEQALQHVKANADDLDAAKKHLIKIDKLRKQYHKIHEPSFWQLLFAN